jgi:hypothetical protein
MSMLRPGTAASTAGPPVLPAVVIGFVAGVAMIFLLVRVVAILVDVAMAIKALLTNSGAADSILRRNNGRR